MSARSGKTLLQILTRMGELMGVTYNTSISSVRPNWVATLNEAIADLQDKHQFDFLKERHDIPAQRKQRYYALPSSLGDGSAFIQFVQYKFGSAWREMAEGISSQLYTQYNSEFLDPDTGLPDPITGPFGQRWQRLNHDGSIHIEVWPVPSVDQDANTLENTIRIWAMKTLPELVDDGDVFEPDARLIMYPAIAEIYNRRGNREQYTYWNGRAITVAKNLSVNESNREPIIIGQNTADEEPRPMRGYRSLIVS